jgi:hypothetical protein
MEEERPVHGPRSALCRFLAGLICAQLAVPDAAIAARAIRAGVRATNGVSPVSAMGLSAGGGAGEIPLAAPTLETRLPTAGLASPALNAADDADPLPKKTVSERRRPEARAEHSRDLEIPGRRDDSGARLRADAPGASDSLETSESPADERSEADEDAAGGTSGLFAALAEISARLDKALERQGLPSGSEFDGSRERAGSVELKPFKPAPRAAGLQRQGRERTRSEFKDPVLDGLVRRYRPKAEASGRAFGLEVEFYGLKREEVFDTLQREFGGRVEGGFIEFDPGFIGVRRTEYTYRHPDFSDRAVITHFRDGEKQWYGVKIGIDEYETATLEQAKEKISGIFGVEFSGFKMRFAPDHYTSLQGTLNGKKREFTFEYSGYYKRISAASTRVAADGVGAFEEQVARWRSGEDRLFSGESRLIGSRIGDVDLVSEGSALEINTSVLSPASSEDVVRMVQALHEAGAHDEDESGTKNVGIHVNVSIDNANVAAQKRLTLGFAELRPRALTFFKPHRTRTMIGPQKDDFLRAIEDPGLRHTPEEFNELLREQAAGRWNSYLFIKRHATRHGPPPAEFRLFNTDPTKVREAIDFSLALVEWAHASDAPFSAGDAMLDWTAAPASSRRGDGGVEWSDVVSESAARVEENFEARGWELSGRERLKIRERSKAILERAVAPMRERLKSLHGSAAGAKIDERVAVMRDMTVELPRFKPGVSPRSNPHLTGLFRHKDKWLAETRRLLREEVIPRERERAAAGEVPEISLRSLGAATGLEPLSLAVLVDRELRRAGENPDLWGVRIDAMEINPAALVFMTLGRHKAEYVEDIVHGPTHDPRPPDLMRDARRVLGRRAADYFAAVEGKAGWYELTPEFSERFSRWLNPVWYDLTDVDLRPVVDDGGADAVFAMGIHGVLPAFTAAVQPWLETAGWKRPGKAGLLATTVAEESFWERRDPWTGALRLGLMFMGWRILSTSRGRFKLLRVDAEGALETRPVSTLGRWSASLVSRIRRALS